MTTEDISFPLHIYDNSDQLKPEDRELLEMARRQTENAYAPYSHFRVGAAAVLANNEFVKGSNQENAAYPAGICAERVLMSTAATLFPGVGIRTIAISYHNENGKSDHPISPCGVCRQSFFEFQARTATPIRVLLSGMEGKVYEIENSAQLLPLVFSADDMK